MEPIIPIGGAGDNFCPSRLTIGSQAPVSGDAVLLSPSTAVAPQATAVLSTHAGVSELMFRVDAFLGQFGLDLRDNELLRMIIGLFILELLLGSGSESNRSQRERLSVLAELATRSESHFVLLFQSSASVVQFEPTMTMLAGDPALPTPSGSGVGIPTENQIDLSI